MEILLRDRKYQSYPQSFLSFETTDSNRQTTLDTNLRKSRADNVKIDPQVQFNLCNNYNPSSQTQ